MTKVEAIVEVLKENGGAASWRHIYDNIEKYYPAAKASENWEAGIRGVLYREIKDDKLFKKVGLGVFALKEYAEEKVVHEITDNPIKKHAYIESLLVEIGNNEDYDTYCADPSALYRPGVPVSELTTVKDFPVFTYPAINAIAKRIDVIWFPKNGYLFPKKVIEVVDSISTLTNSLQRMYQLKDFHTDFIVVAPSEYIQKVRSALTVEPYRSVPERFTVRSYEEIETQHKHLLAAREFEF